MNWLQDVNCRWCRPAVAMPLRMKKGEVVKLELVDMVSKTGRRNAHCTAEVMWSHELTPSLHGNGCVIREGSDSLSQMMRDYCKVS